MTPLEKASTIGGKGERFSLGNSLTGLIINWERLISLGLVALILFSPLFRASLPIWAITSVYLIVLLLLTIWLVRIREDREFRFTRTPLDLPILFFILFTSFSLIRSINIHHSITGLYRLLAYFLIYFLVVNNIKSKIETKKVVLSLLGISIFVTLYGLIEFFTHNFAPPFSTFPNPNAFASFLLISLSLSLGIVFFAKERGGIKKIIPVLMIILFLLAIIATKSRGAFLSLIGIIIFLGFLKGRRYALIALALTILAFSLLPTPTHSPLVRLITVGGKDPYAYTRISIWKSALSIFKDHPFLGTGLGTFKDAFPGYNFPVEEVFARFGKKASFAHCEYLQLLSETGIFSLAIFIWLIIVFFRRIKKTLKSQKGREEYGLLVGLTAGIIGVLIHSLIDFPLHAPAIPIILAINSGLLMGSSPLQFTVHSSPFTVLGKRYYLYLVLIILILGYAIIAPYLADIYAEKEEYEKAIAQDPLCGKYHFELANLYVKQYGEMSDPYYRIDAYREFKKAIRLEPRNSYYHRRLAKFYHQNFKGGQRIDSAVQEMEKALELSPYDCFLYCELGSLYTNEGRYEEAIKNYKKAVKLEPNYAQAHYNLGRIYEDLGKTEIAKEEYKRAQESRNRGLAKENRTKYEDQLIALQKRK